MSTGVDAAPGIVAIVLVTVATLALGAYGLRFSRTTSDFMVASRAVGPRMNASAISGEYLSAASFLGVAGLLLTFGADMLWYPVGWTAGYLVLLVLVAAPQPVEVVDGRKHRDVAVGLAGLSEVLGGSGKEQLVEGLATDPGAADGERLGLLRGHLAD